MGIGRAGLTAAILLVLNGYTPERACEELSRKRNFSVPDTDEQRDWVKALYQHMQEQG
jgi:protein-tyrosine phosphatase